MAKFNPGANVETQLKRHSGATLNFEGGLAFEMDAKTRLYTRVATSLVGADKFYQEGNEHDAAILEDILRVAEVDPEFVLKLAAYVRNVLYLRSVPVMMLVEAARIPACKPFVRLYTPSIVQRADELTEAVAYWVTRVGQIGSRGEAGGEHAFPNCLKRGLADAFANFDEYQLVKYDREGEVKLKDVLRVIDRRVGYPVGRAMREYLVNGVLDESALPLTAAKAQLMQKSAFDEEAEALARTAHATWEVLISKFGSSKEVWEAVIPMMGYMAKLRNLRNFFEKDVELTPVLEHLTNPNAVRKSKQLPFRFLSAYRVIEELNGPRGGEVLSAVAKALQLSVANLPHLDGTTFIAIDNSGSMQKKLNEKSSVSYADIGNLLGAIAYSMCERAIVGAFGTDFAPVNVNSLDSIMTNMQKFKQADTRGSATNAYRVMQYLNGAWNPQDSPSDRWGWSDRARGHFSPQLTPIKVDRIIVLSDMQCYDADARNIGYALGRGEGLAAELRKYRSSVNPNVYVYGIDLAGYGTAQFPEDEPKAAMLAGWSDKVLEFIRLFEEDRTQAIERISSYTPAPEREAVVLEEVAEEAVVVS